MELFNSLLNLLDKNPNWVYGGIGFVVGVVAPKVFRVLFFVLKKLGFIFTFYSLIPTFVLKKIYPKKGMARKVVINVESRDHSLVFELSKRSRCRIWLKITNNLPFDIEFEELSARVYVSEVQINVALADELKINKLSKLDDVVLMGELSKEQELSCTKRIEKYLAVEITGRYKTRFNYIDTNSGHLTSYHVRDLRVGGFRFQ